MLRTCLRGLCIFTDYHMGSIWVCFGGLVYFYKIFLFFFLLLIWPEVFRLRWPLLCHFFPALYYVYHSARTAHCSVGVLSYNLIGLLCIRIRKVDKLFILKSFSSYWRAFSLNGCFKRNAMHTYNSISSETLHSWLGFFLYVSSMNMTIMRNWYFVHIVLNSTKIHN